MALVATMVYTARDAHSSYAEQYANYHLKLSQPPAPSTSTELNVTPPALSDTTHLEARMPLLSQRSRSSTISDDESKPLLPSISNLLAYRQDGHTPDDYVKLPQHASNHSFGEYRNFREGTKLDVYGSIDRSLPLPPPPPLISMSREESMNQSYTPRPSATPVSHGVHPHLAGSILQQPPILVDSRFPTRQLLPSQPHTVPTTYAASPHHTMPNYHQAPHPGNQVTYHQQSQIYQRPPDPHPQRLLPSSFPPPPAATVHGSSASNHSSPIVSHSSQSSTASTSMHEYPPNAGSSSSSASPWASHHHYISASSQIGYPQSPERYTCHTCSKAFSRPSSLKIHLHSHTGEKPFRCPHEGCGKAFSVRSNMKRHERGCHSTLLGTGGHLLPHSHLM